MSDNKPTTTRNVSFEQKMYIALAYAGMNLMNGIVGGSLLKYYVDYMNFPPILFGIVFFIFAIWNAINDPMVGFYSDKRKPEEGKGKRVYFLKMAIPLAVIGFFIVLLPNPSWNVVSKFIVLLAGLVIFETAVTLVYVNNYALIIGLTDNGTERSEIAMINNYVNTPVGAITGLIPFFFLTGGFSLDFILTIFIMIGIVGICILIFAVFRIDEPTEIYGEYHPLKVKESLRETFNSKAFRCILFIGFALSGISAAFGGTILFYIGDVFGVTYFWAVLPAIIAGGLQFLMMPLIIKISKRLGTRNTLILFMFVMVVGYIGFFFVTDYWVMIFFYWCILTGFSAHGLMNAAANGDIIDEDELKTGQRREGMFGGIGALFTIPAGGLFILVFTIIISIYGYDSSRSIQDTQALYGIRLGMTLFPIIFLIIGIFVLLFYPLHGEYYEQMSIKVKALYEEKMKTRISTQDKTDISVK